MFSRKIDTQTAVFKYANDNFNLNIWARRAVPQVNLKWLETKEITAEFDSKTAVVTFNPKNNRDTIAIRIISTNHDHYSDLAPTFNLKRKEPPAYDLKMICEHEWFNREDLKRQEIRRLEIEWDIWREYENERLEQEEQPKSRDPKEAKHKKKKLKYIPEPIRPHSETAVDIEDAFLQNYNTILDAEIQANSPDVFHIEPDEINLRCFRIMNVIFHVNGMIQATQTKEVELKVFQNLDLRQILQIDDFPVLKKGEYITIKLKLPDNVFWWIPPIPCKWIEYANKSNENESNHNGGALFSAPEIKKNFTNIDVIEDFDLVNPPNDLSVNFILFLQRHVVPRVPDTYKFEVELDEEKEILRKKMLKQKEIEMEKAEEHARRKGEFNERMNIFKNDEMVILAEELQQLELVLAEARETAKRKLTNSGESEKNVQKYVKKQEEEDMEYIDGIKRTKIDEIDKIIKKRERDEFQADNTVIEEVVEEEIEAMAEPPKELFPKRYRRFPLRIVCPDSDDVFEFDIPNIIENVTFDFTRPDENFVLASYFLNFMKSLSHLEESHVFGKRVRITRAKPNLKEIELLNDQNLEEEEEQFAGRWMTSNLEIINFNTETCEITFKTDHFGIFGFAMPKYCLYPIVNWTIEPETNTKQQIIFITLEMKFFKLQIEVTVDGYTASIINPKEYRCNFMEDNIPVNFKTFKNTLVTRGVNIFPELDAQHYITSACVKPSSMEKHIAYCISQFALTFKFARDPYNRLSDNRTALIYATELIEGSDKIEVREIMTNPERSMFVHTSEKCTSLSIVELKYTEVPDEQEFNPDVYYLLMNTCNELSKRKRDQMRMILKYNLAFLLEQLKLLSYS